MRITGREHHSLGLLVGSFPRAPKGWKDSLVAIIMAQPNGQGGNSSQLHVEVDTGQDLDVTLDDGQPIFRNPDFPSPPNFKIQTDRLYLSFSGRQNCSVDAEVGPFRFQMKCRDNGIPWGPGGASPEGPMATWPSIILGQHWFVHSFSTSVQYSLCHRARNTCMMKGQGTAHLEKNWGRKLSIYFHRCVSVHLHCRKGGESADKGDHPPNLFLNTTQ
jgi:hypothetical protein